MAGYDITRKAQDDLIEIWHYTNNTWSLEQAEVYYDQIISEFEVIVRNPLIGKSYEKVKEGVRGLILEHHIIFYWIQPNEKVEIIRILNQSEDIKTKL